MRKDDHRSTADGTSSRLLHALTCRIEAVEDKDWERDDGQLQTHLFPE